MWFKILIACIPAMIYGIFLDDIIEPYLYNATTVAIMLDSVRCAFIIIENWNKGKHPRSTAWRPLTCKDAPDYRPVPADCGNFSRNLRSGATIVGALLIGVSRVIAAEFTFFLAIPVMFGASLLKLVKFGFHFTMTEASPADSRHGGGFLPCPWGVISFLMGYIKKHDFKVFGGTGLCWELLSLFISI